MLSIRHRRRYYLCFLLILLYIFADSLISREVSIPSNSNRIFYLIRTSSQFYNKRLVYLLQTWISQVIDHAYFVTDRPLAQISADHMILTKDNCGEDTHSMNSLCCKTAHDFLLFDRFQFDYDWFCHFDDDQYVNTKNLQEYLSTLNANEPFYIGRNSWSSTLKRSKEPYPHPFWFATLGAGVCLSKRTVELLRPYTRKISDFTNGCVRENYHDDIYLGFLLNAFLNISLTKNLRFHSHLEKLLYQDRRHFLRTFRHQISFGFRLPDRYPLFLPTFYPKRFDPFLIRTLHCLLFPQIDECHHRLLHFLFNTTFEK